MDFMSPWCSTKVDAANEHVMGNFGNCNANCLFQAPPKPFNPFGAPKGAAPVVGTKPGGPGASPDSGPADPTSAVVAAAAKLGLDSVPEAWAD